MAAVAKTIAFSMERALTSDTKTKWYVHTFTRKTDASDLAFTPHARLARDKIRIAAIAAQVS